MLFDGRCRQLASFAFDPYGDMQRFHIDNRRHTGHKRAPIEKFGDSPNISATRVRVANVRGEKFQKTKLRLITAPGRPPLVLPGRNTCDGYFADS